MAKVRGSEEGELEPVAPAQAEQQQAQPQAQAAAPQQEQVAAHAAQPEQAQAPQPTWKFQLLVDREAKWSESRYWKEFAIGHAWIRVLGPDNTHDSWGYWPDLEGGHAVDPSAPWKSIPGKVRHPDDAHSPNAMQTTPITEDVAGKVRDAANAKEGSPGNYNLFTYNCTTFAAQMAKIAGAPVPSFSTLGIANPNSLFSGIEASNKSAGKDPMEQPLPPPAE